MWNGIFGNPIRQKRVNRERYRQHLLKVMEENPKAVRALKKKMEEGYELFCPGCGIGSPTCHARIIEEELTLKPKSVTI
jgi:hypothetical protein